MSDPLDFTKIRRIKYMNYYENKMTMCVLPLCAALKVETVYLVGFDGGGSRHHGHGKNLGKKQRKTYEAFLPKWIEWKKYHGMELKTLNSGDESILTDFLPTGKV